MTTRRWLAAWLMAAMSLVARPAGAASAADSLLLEGSTPERLRASLLDFVASAPETAVVNKGAAWFYAGMSYEHAGRADSALLCYEQAVAARGGPAERDAYVDALLQRGRPGDADRALEVLKARLEIARFRSERDIAATRGRWAWARYVQGHGDSALAGLRLQERWLVDDLQPRHRDWQYRLGLVELESGLPSKCIDLMVPLAVGSRFQDRDVMGILKDAAQKTPEGRNLADFMKQQLLRGDAVDKEILDSLGGKRVQFTGADGYALSGLVFAKPGARRARAAIAVLDPDETFDAYDSLAAGLVRAGYALLVLEPRGCGWSVSPTCPLPETWRGREDEIHHLVARDAIVAIRALAGAASVDTTRYLLIGAKASASIVVEAAALDRRVRALVLFSPDPAPVDRGPMRSRLRSRKPPVFFVVPIMQLETLPMAEALYEALDPRASRISESEMVGLSAGLFRHDPSALPRLLRWLDESWGRPTAGGAAVKGKRK